MADETSNNASDTTIYDLLPNLKRRHSTRLSGASQPSQEKVVDPETPHPSIGNDYPPSPPISTIDSNGKMTPGPTKEAVAPEKSSNKNQESSEPGPPDASNTTHAIDLTTSSVFAYNDADIILRSNDNVEFRVHKQILNLASQEFRDLVQNPRKTSKRRKILPDAEISESLPVRAVDETEDDLETLLRFVYPIGGNFTTSLSSLTEDICLLGKWGLVAIQNELGERLAEPNFISDDPVKAYDHAKYFGYENARHAALKALYALPFEGDEKYFMSEDLDLNAKDLQQIMSWKNRYLDEVLTIVEDYTVPKPTAGTSCKNCISASRWCWWGSFKNRARNTSDLLGPNELEKTIFASMDSKACSASHSEVFGTVSTLCADLRKKIDALPVEHASSNST
ncbi:hypothetical protein SISSUDRAFT_1050386 [Sistotremastrum suecicum HHB10207 ss-3]|uniref:BTB domain-containing protein n=1 Tax=Sistotremastrum suecicum HHB10207 ss-3 TaxID=1314776 RepID=A0A166B8H3_9AGAM|nr:hypothetical protein SISSUDRAFT_1050386 [Sistotremastrum suecicum HHB10207 ss-3]